MQKKEVLPAGLMFKVRQICDEADEDSGVFMSSDSLNSSNNIPTMDIRLSESEHIVDRKATNAELSADTQKSFFDVSSYVKCGSIL